MLPVTYTVTLNSDFTGVRFGLHFLHGKAQTENEFLASRLNSKGYNVFVEKSVSPIDIDDIPLLDLGEDPEQDDAIDDVTEDEVFMPIEETAKEDAPRTPRKGKAKEDTADGGI